MEKDKYNEYQRQYKRKNIKQIKIDVQKEKKELIDEYVRSKGMKMSDYLRMLIKEESGIDI